MINSFMGLKITVSPHATELIRLFPDAKRTKRGRRRLLAKYGKRFPGLQRRIPCALKTPFGLVVHPDIYAELKRRTTTAASGSR